MIFYIGRGNAFGHWRIRIGRFYIGLWWHDAGAWQWFKRYKSQWFANFSIFGRLIEIRWYDEGGRP